jgi:hypothetical protein
VGFGAQHNLVTKWDRKWPNSAAKWNYDHGLFPDPGWDVGKVATEVPPGPAVKVA